MSNADRIPSGGPVIVVANHPNGLVDPVVLGLGLSRPVAFLAKSTLFSNPVTRLLTGAFGAIPVYRAADGQGTGRNQETFALCRERLLEGRWIALFPEGTTHDDPAMKQFKTGAARIALDAQAGAGEETAVQILPVGLIYEDKQIFRSRVAVSVGTPLDVREYAADPSADTREKVQRLTAAIHEALGRVTLEADNHELWRGFMAVAAWTNPDSSADLATRETQARTLAEAYRRLVAMDPERAEEVVSFTRRFVRKLEAVGVRDPLHLESAAQPGEEALARSRRAIQLLAPVALIGAVLSWLPYRLVKPLAHLAAAGKVELIGTFKVLIGLVIMTITYLTEAALVGTWLGWPAGLATLVIAPATGFAALRFHERLVLQREALRARWLRSTRAEAAAEISQRRQELCRVVERTLREVFTATPAHAPAGGPSGPGPAGERAGTPSR